MDSMRAQALRFGAKMLRGSVVSCDLASKNVTLDDGTLLHGDTLIIATGASAKYLFLRRLEISLRSPALRQYLRLCSR